MSPVDSKIVTDDYTSFTSKVTFNSSLDGPMADSLAGKMILHMEASEYRLILSFNDGSKLEVSGATYGDCALGVDVTPATPEDTQPLPTVVQIAQAGFAVVTGLLRLEAELQIGLPVVATNGHGKYFRIFKDAGRIGVKPVEYEGFAMPGVIVRELDSDTTAMEG